MEIERNENEEHLEEALSRPYGPTIEFLGSNRRRFHGSRSGGADPSGASGRVRHVLPGAGENFSALQAAAGEPGRSPYVFRPNGWQSSRIRRYVSADAFPGLGLGESGKENLEETHKVPGAGRKVLRKEKLKSDQLT